jgi:hypothetical protein
MNEPRFGSSSCRHGYQRQQCQQKTFSSCYLPKYATNTSYGLEKSVDDSMNAEQGYNPKHASDFCYSRGCTSRASTVIAISKTQSLAALSKRLKAVIHSKAARAYNKSHLYVGTSKT